ncbi:MAG: 23S rRNA (guanosine(2251)-2'-O)-methyltransferase RlmB [Bacteroidetes bacterium]|nr:23S rRNA (guanosine(2251)-2'-O)-methyltransferase RlmB [Bacteroidota bacterium]
MSVPEKNTLIFGRHPIVDALKSGARLDKIFLQSGVRGEFEQEIRQLCKEYDVPLQYVPKERMARMVKGNHQGIIGHLALLDYYRLEDVVPGIFEKGETPLLLLLDRVTDVRNLGAIARSAEVCGVQALVVPKSGSALINSDAIKTSAGALTRLAVCRENSLVTAVEYLQNSGIQVLASDLKAEKFVFQMDLTLPTALVIGSEDEGVQPALLSRVSGRFRIPQQGATDSFNVSVATGIMLYEALRQRMLPA